MGRKSGAKLERRTKQAAKATRVAAGVERGCLICRKSDGGFESVEHVVPESLGNSESHLGAEETLVLDNGVVCDRCNNGPLSKLDQVLCEFWPIMFRRTALGIRSKAGKVPDTTLVNGIFEHRAGMEPRLKLTQSKKFTFKETARVDDLVSLNAVLSGGKRLTEKYVRSIAQSLLKIGLELMWHDQGSLALEQRFDHVREAILGRPWPGFLVIIKQGEPGSQSVSFTYSITQHEGAFGMAVWCHVYGVTLATHSSLPSPVVSLPVELAEVLQFGE